MTEDKLETMRRLRDEGKSLREIGAVVGIDHPQTVHHYLKRYPNPGDYRGEMPEIRHLRDENRRLRNLLVEFMLNRNKEEDCLEINDEDKPM